MKPSRTAWLFVALALLLAVALVLFLPARWLLPWLQPRLHGLSLEGVHGLVWNGSAERLLGPDGRPLGRLRWQLSRRALWGDVDLDLALDGPQLTAHGRLQRDAQGRLLWRGVTAQLDLADWTGEAVTPLGRPQGRLDITLPRVLLQGGWPLALQGQVHWHDAAMRTRGGGVALGDLTMALEGANGVLQGRLRDDGDGPLAADGRWQASSLGWRLDLRLQPRSADTRLRHWLARLGPPAADGSVQLHRRGGLAAAVPGTSP
ncbi:type II secretion system protein N [Fulvimonas yonginensis]|uniref:Type II secretion system protein N n=1 Tax=Fulvimonas yonginensis TaxID=1495200 RepID=A0ABU8J9D4_9GAMM